MGIFRAACLVMMMLLTAACGDMSSKLAGEWIQTDGSRPQTKLILRKDGTGKLEVHGGVNYQLDNWSVASERHLKFKIYNQDVLTRFILNADSLELSRAESFDEMNGTYRRVTDG